MKEGPRTHSKTGLKESQWVHVLSQRLRCQSRGSFEYDCGVFPQLPYSNFFRAVCKFDSKRVWGRIERDTCTPVFIAALFIIARSWKQPRCPSADKWIRTPWYIYTMEYYSAIKRNTFESVLMRWMKLEPIIQSEVSQKEKHQYSILMHIYGIQKDGNDNPVCETAKETQMYKSLLDSVGEGKGGMIWENGIEICIISYVK